MDQRKFYLISPNYAEAGTLETLPATPGLRVIKNDSLERSNIRFSSDDLICITSEASIEVVKERIDDPAKRNAINMLKDKYQFREILREIYPAYTFKKLSLGEIASLNVASKSILKPSKGCFGTAVKTITAESDMTEIVKEIKRELKINSNVLSGEVLSEDEFILEDYIEGEEYAVDMFYDPFGEPHIVNIYHHPMPKNEAYLHMIYYTSKEVFHSIYEQAMGFFKKLNALLKIKNFTMHSEFRYCEKTLVPVEINCMRFGGMGLGNMVYNALGLNPYESFRTGQSPEWSNIWDKKANADSIYAYFIAYNGTHIDKTRQKPNIEKLKKEFTEILHETIFDYQNQLAFAVFCLKETPENLKRLLTIEFKDYFEEI
ncbi:MAG TPA: ATP-grasp domain-containing protein [Eudoraea sp.]|nr:ATP-grasp domain-containing protein [Eudoraea sp.]